MSQTFSQRNIFTFSLQEEKFNQMKNLSFSSNPLLTNKNMSEKYQKSDRAPNDIDNIPNDVDSLNQNEINKFTIRQSETEFIKPALEKLKNQLTQLKSYINRLNKEIRKKFEKEIPILDNFQFDSKNFSEENFSEISKIFSDSFDRLLNPEYLNPIFSIYDNHLLNLENELKYYKNLLSKYEIRIQELTKENSNLRESFLIQSQEMKDLLEKRIKNNSFIPNDEEFFKFLEERNDILSKENEILAMNYQKVSKELFDFSLNYSEKYNESIQKIERCDNLQSEIKRLTFILEDIMTKNKIYENKFMQLTEEVSRLEIEKNNYIILCEKFRADNETLTEANLFYKNFIERNK
jgi:hypothetical protein